MILKGHAVFVARLIEGPSQEAGSISDTNFGSIIEIYPLARLEVTGVRLGVGCDLQGAAGRDRRLTCNIKSPGLPG